MHMQNCSFKMHSLRRAATRVSLASVFSSAAAPRTQSISLGLRSALALKCFSIATPRAFSRSAVLRDEQVDNRDNGHASSPTATHTVYINHYPLGATEQDIRDAFARFGEVLKVDMPVRKNYCFVHFSNAESALQAVDKVNDTLWQGRRITVSMSSSFGARPSNPMRWSQSRSTKDMKVFNTPTTTLYVGNISFDATDDDLKQLFSGLQYVKDVRIAVDKTTGWPRGFAHVEFHSVRDAKVGKEMLDGQSIRGRALFINFAPDTGSNGVRRLDDKRQVREQLLTEQQPAEKQGKAVQAEEQNKQ